MGKFPAPEGYTGKIWTPSLEPQPEAPNDNLLIFICRTIEFAGTGSLRHSSLLMQKTSLVHRLPSGTFGDEYNDCRLEFSHTVTHAQANQTE